MKRLIGALFVLMSLTFAQAQTYEQTSQTQTTVIYTDWRLSNDGCYGCASFYWKVNKTYIPTYQTYQYDVCFYSNSFYANGVWASTYVWGLLVNVDGYYIHKEPSWLLFKEAMSNQVTSFYSVNANPNIVLTWQGIKLY